ncbi:MAG: FG-GAP repeat protein [candidate division Zixibacteria bacterium]|nr:FG-GAP repeat protein [candidate division Zixibacteria bacterium]
MSSPARRLDVFGYSVASAGDVDNDGFDDLIVGAYGNDAGGANAGRAYVFSGLNGDTIYVFTGKVEFGGLGFSVASAGDFNNDGIVDLIVGTLRNRAGGTDAGRAYVFSGSSGDTLNVFTGEVTRDAFGFSVASAGDVNDDGFDDIIVGAHGNDAGGSFAGRAYVFSGRYFCCGDPNGDGLVNFDDVDYLMNFYFYGGDTPFPYSLSDLNCDGSVDIADITYLAAYINGTGAAPCCAE